MSEATDLRHRTLETGHERVLPLAEAEPDVLEQLRPLLHEAIKGDAPVHVGGDYWMTASLDGGRLKVRIWHTEPSGPPLVEMTVTRGVGREVLPLLEVSIAGLQQAVADGRPPPKDVVAALEDLERCLAWAWLT